ncbi:glutamate-cysteine ligase family protein [Pelagicoccus sp. SDUM812003]|uniref:carboxylate-amine ligase n=1 Tax=Pelagicoccus sp. SDUM812003 TaxID=3041267 RepID=UPI0028106F4A|nr:glutamate-cysteine ligase family protein [Pelagicoccus sp. SDUM812003]MDQ8201911.1 glutamate-cysteine ligase family protein [Pelagicoccus sp. SDUM812003]
MITTDRPTLSLFQAFGIELEYMIVDRDSLRPRPIAESILLDADGNTVQEVSLGSIDVSNELATHVLEFKTAAPTSDLEKLENDFAAAITEMNKRLATQNAMLAPGGMHPFMNPEIEGRTWSKGDRTIYETYDRIFSCKSHGWFNLQSCHINLPFANEQEFARLHAAIILILPYLPALCASSPFIEGEHRGSLDTRILVYKNNQIKVPEIIGSIIPEPVFSYAEYQSQILQKTYAAIAPLDPDGILQYEWLNSRGAIARFDRNAIEIRLLDTQECPTQDIGICSLIIALLEKLCSLDIDELKTLARRYPPERRKQQLLAIAQDGFEADLDLRDLADVFQLNAKATTVGELWDRVVDELKQHPRVSKRKEALGYVLQEGNLAERLLNHVGATPTQKQLETALRELANCLAQGKPFVPNNR